MHILSLTDKTAPAGPLLSRRANFAAVRSLLIEEDRPLARQTLFLGNSYAKIDPEPLLGRGSTEFVAVAEDLSVVVSDVDFAVDTAYRYPGEDWIRFGFNVSGNVSLSFDGVERSHIGPGSAHLMLHPEGVVQGEVYSARSRTRWVSVLCRKEHLTETLGFDPEELPFGLRRFVTDGEHVPYFDQRPFTRIMQRCITDMFRSPATRALRPLYLKAKAYEAIYAYLEDFAAEQRPAERVAGLSRRDVDRLHEARSILDSDSSAEVSLGSLARQLGLNRSKLSRGFHALFGTTLLEYNKTRRLAAAYELLRDTGLSTTQVAERCGYRHVSTFSAAFKEHYHSTPREMRQSQLWREASASTNDMDDALVPENRKAIDS